MTGWILVSLGKPESPISRPDAGLLMMAQQGRNIGSHGMKTSDINFTLQQDAEGFFEIVEGNKDGSSILWDARFPTKEETLSAIETYKRRLQCRFGWGL